VREATAERVNVAAASQCVVLYCCAVFYREGLTDDCSGAVTAAVARAGGGNLERINDSTCFQTRGSHTISMWDFMKIRSHQGYASHRMGFAA